MWLMTTIGFFSVVQNMRDPDTLLVRARDEDDLKALAEHIAPIDGDVKIIETRVADYPYRIVASRRAMSAFLGTEIENLHYPNFKNEVARKSPKHAKVYEKVWSTLRALEDRAKRIFSRGTEPAKDPQE